MKVIGNSIALNNLTYSNEDAVSCKFLLSNEKLNRLTNKKRTNLTQLVKAALTLSDTCGPDFDGELIIS